MAEKDKMLVAYEDGALEGIAAIRSFLKYQGANRDYMHKAKAGAVLAGGYTRLRATLANEASIRLALAKSGKA